MTQLSEHFTLVEATHSDKAIELGIDNSCTDPEIITAASYTAVRMEAVRKILGYPIHVNSWIRCQRLNDAVGSKDTSQHLIGQAVDFVCPDFGTPLQICEILIEKREEIGGWDQLILEHTWVHISWKSTPNAQQRNSILSLLASGGYAIGLTDKEGHHYG